MLTASACRYQTPLSGFASRGLQNLHPRFEIGRSSGSRTLTASYSGLSAKHPEAPSWKSSRRPRFCGSYLSRRGCFLYKPPGYQPEGLVRVSE